MINVLEIMKTELEKLDIPYTFDSWDTDLELPQFVGEILETPTNDEDSKNEYSFILTGYDVNYGYLFDVSNQLRNKYKNSLIVDGVVIKYDNTQTISNEKDDLKQIEVNFKIKEWSVNS